MKRIVLLVFVTIIFWGCDKIDEKDLTVIEGLKLGINKNDMDLYLNSPKIKKGNFISQNFFTNISILSLRDYTLPVYYTDIFDFQSGYPEIHHLGILRCATLENTNMVVSITATLVHTNFVNGIGYDGKQCDLTKESNLLGIDQNIPKYRIEHIKKLLSEKYGKPDEEGSFSQRISYLDKNRVVEEQGYITGAKWKTKYFDIYLSEGFPSKTRTFDKKNRNYNGYIPTNGKYTEIKDFSDNQLPCVEFAFIRYQLNKETIEKLKKNTNNL